MVFKRFTKDSSDIDDIGREGSMKHDDMAVYFMVTDSNMEYFQI
jgi:hypothetical protein